MHSPWRLTPHAAQCRGGNDYTHARRSDARERTQRISSHAFRISVLHRSAMAAMRRLALAQLIRAFYARFSRRCMALAVNARVSPVTAPLPQNRGRCIRPVPPLIGPGCFHGAPTRGHALRLTDSHSDLR